MAVEPASTAAGVSLTVLAVALLGPLAGPYALIAFASLAGAMWPLSADTTVTRMAGAWLLLRCTLTAILLTVFLSSIIERIWGFPVSDSIGTVALMIGALGNGWRPVFGSLADAIRLAIGRIFGGEGAK